MKKKQFILGLLLFISCTCYVNAQVKNAVGQRTFSFEDNSRSRKLVTEVWYPTTSTPYPNEESPFERISTARDGLLPEGKFPVILFSHGTGGGRLTVEWLCAGLASRGFIVIAVDHFGNTYDNSIPVEFVKFWERPQDLTFVLNQLLKVPEISRVMNVDKIGVAGFSLGGYTALALAGAQMDFDALQNYFNTEEGKKEAEVPEMPGVLSFLGKADVKQAFKSAPPLRDDRIKSVFVISPALGQAFPSRENFKDVKVPVYIVAAANDQIAPVKTNAAHYAALIKDSQYKPLGEKAGHYVFLNVANDVLKGNVPLYFRDEAGVDRSAIHAQTLTIALGHFKRTLK